MSKETFDFSEALRRMKNKPYVWTGYGIFARSLNLYHSDKSKANRKIQLNALLKKRKHISINKEL